MERLFVIGNPIKHSLSPFIYHAFASDLNIKIKFHRKLVPVNSIKEFLNKFKKQNIKGVSITAPFKIDAYHFSDIKTDRAANAKAVNIIKFLNNQCIGDNTDGVGIVKDITMNLRWNMNNKNILLLGAGGAIQGILGSILECKPKNIVLLNRSLDKAINLVSSFSHIQKIGIIKNEDLIKDNNKISENFDIIINGTSTGLEGNLPSFIKYINPKNSFCYDMNYSLHLTPFCKWAKSYSCIDYSDGLGMLVEQAAEGFNFLYNLKPETKTVLIKLRSWRPSKRGSLSKQ